jgi:hypothetical protein
MEFDFQDDEQDRQIADIKNVRMQRWNLGLQSGALDTRTAREQMLLEGDLDQAQFDRLELGAGRLSDGTDVLNLFYSDDKAYSKYLELGIDGDPLDVTQHNPEEVLMSINEKMPIARADSVNLNTKAKRWTAYQCVVALERLKKLYTVGDMLEEQPPATGAPPMVRDGVPTPDPRTASGTRRVNNLAPNRNVQQDNMKPDSEDRLPKQKTEAGEAANFFQATLNKRLNQAMQAISQTIDQH